MAYAIDSQLFYLTKNVPNTGISNASVLVKYALKVCWIFEIVIKTF